MRRGFSIFLILFFGLGPLSAFVDGSEDAGLPACCRRHGAHHCAMYAQIMAMRAGRGIDPTPSFSAPPTCPLYPGRMRSHSDAGSRADGSQRRVCAVLADSRCRVRADARRFSTPSRAHAGRGPPAQNLELSTALNDCPDRSSGDGLRHFARSADCRAASHAINA